MSAPPLPDIFGNYALGDFVEVVPPEAISWLPQTAGWAWLGALLAVVILRYGWRKLRHWHRNRYRREAALRLQQLAQGAAHDSWLIELNKLLKLTALAAFSREQVARLSGQEWVAFLNQHCASPPFSPDHCRLLARGVYEGATVPDAMRQSLLVACRQWVEHHEGPSHV
ncbi:MAG: DUF4381 domain-containing protein [Halioglobus sp.]|nr:DUF4381 domain-containing protein [Halioglobus sp.]